MLCECCLTVHLAVEVTSNDMAECCCCDVHCGIVCWQEYRLRSHNILGSLLVLCREALVRVAGGPELFLSMRGTYTASLAAVSMAGYVAGVGDRHTDNFLVDLNSGALVPIDFGQAPSHLPITLMCCLIVFTDNCWYEPFPLIRAACLDLMCFLGLWGVTRY